MTNAICSKLWTDVDIRMPTNRISNCCKSWQWEKYSPKDVKEMGVNFLNNRPELIADKKFMIDHNELPKNCGECKQVYPGGYFGAHNTWKKKTNAEISKDINNFYKVDGTFSIEIMLSTTCNMSCMYCNKFASSTWADVLNEPRIESNPEWKQNALNNVYEYVKMDHCKWKPLKFNFTGGEPLLDWDIFKIIKSLTDNAKKDPDKKLKHDIDITSNLNIKEKLLEKFLNLVLNDNNFIWNLSVSLDEIGPSKIRDGLVWERVKKNIKTVIDSNLFQHITFLPSISNLSLYNHAYFIDYVNDVFFIDNKTYIDQHGGGPWWELTIGNNMIYGPEALSITIAPSYFKKYVEEAILACSNIDCYKTHKMFLEQCLNDIGINRNLESIKKAKEWFQDQEKIKNISYEKYYPHIKDILNGEKNAI